MITCSMRVSSARTIGNFSGKSVSMVCFFDCVPNRSAIRFARLGSDTSARLRVSPPACRRDASSRSSIILLNRSASSSMTASESLMVDLSHFASSRRSVDAYPLMSVTGVRSSWLTMEIKVAFISSAVRKWVISRTLTMIFRSLPSEESSGAYVTPTGIGGGRSRSRSPST